MKKILTTAFAAAMAFTGTAATSLTASAAPVVPQVKIEGTSDVVNVRHNRRGFYRQGDTYWYNGHRGYRNHRRGYRNYNGWWFPGGAFIAGAIISGAIGNPGPGYYAPRRVYRGGTSGAHVRWCYNRYRSYDARSNTYQPYNGPRRQCWSPYS